MAEGPGDQQPAGSGQDQASGGWSWGSIFQAARDKSAEVMEFVKRDLDEFSVAMSNQASNVVTSTATVLKDKLKLDDEESTAGSMKKSISTLLGQVNEVLNPQPDDEDEEAMVIQGDQPVSLSPFQKKLVDLANDGTTFLIDPAEDKILAPQFQAWLECQEENSMNTNRLTRMLASNAHLKANYEKLVPDEISHQQFWQRFLFQKALLEDEEARQQAKQKRLEEEKLKAEEEVQKSLKHGVKVGSSVQLSEEEQIRILQEYEMECEAAARISADLPMKPDHYSPPGRDHLKPADIKTRDKRDMVIVGEGPSNSSSGQTSVADKELLNHDESIDGDWEKEFDLEDVEDEVSAG
ncbi:BSD domain-containing protein 1-like isoform X2 [Neocloeon triangulifer]|uniref:BSD domain-containing protein 1-like isoform X2 n=1 Tax=Neocloeon triangulifer TaxID=2078957 RepID=UPI00286EFE81|nr:BSD domain-containing protein 1-like isoform X2 [Neocloeon triangulifer]